MLVTELPFDIDALKRGEDLFPSAIADDPWIAYHGTSGRNARSIEQNGLQGSMGALALKDLEAVAAVFDAMSWHGEIHDGYSVLKPWSLDFDRSGRPKIFLAESSVRAALYATQSYAGGEAMRAVRFCLTDLERYIADPEVRRRHRRQQMVQGTAPPKRSKLVWVKEQLSALEHVAKKCHDIENQHPFGLVYALRFTPADREVLRYSGSMGLISSAPITPDRLIARIRVPFDLQYETCGHMRRLHWVLSNFPGVWSC
jgi:hypothetical protein